MAPPAKRRRRAIVDDDDDDDDASNAGNHQPKSQAQTPSQQSTLTRYLFSSPDKNNSPSSNVSKNPPPTPTPHRNRTAAAAALLASPSPSQSRPPAGRSPSASPLKSRTRAGVQRKRKAAAAAGNAAEDEEENKNNKRGGGGKSADLVALFSRQAQAQAQARARGELGGQRGGLFGNGKGKGVASRGGAAGMDGRDTVGEGEDGEDDDDDDDDVPMRLSGSASSLAGRAQAAHRRFAGVGPPPPAGVGGGKAAAAAVGGGGKRFLRPTTGAGQPSASGAGGKGDSDARPWSERFAPVGLDELAVHKRKVQDVRRWLDEVFAGRTRQRLLVLKGAAGSGKTTTLRLLAREMRCEVLEWRNPASSFGAGPGMGYQSAAAQFEEFLGRGGKFGQLDVETEGTTPPPMQPPPPKDAASGNGAGRGADKRLILVEEFPNTFMRSSVGLTGFRNSVLQFLAANTPSLAGYGFGYNTEPVTPIVMVISETLLTTTSASADSFTAHRLLGPEILRHPGTGVIEFNPVAPTFLTKALELVVQKEARKSGRRRTPGPLVLQRLGEIGDIRNAISSLEFLCVKGDDEADWGSKIAFTKPKRGSKDVPALTKGEQDTLELVSRREATLGIFHAVGKVVYNKRSDFPAGSPEAAAEMLLPAHMAHLARPRRPDVAADTLIDEIGTDTHTFISALHENYALSCEQTGPLDPNSSLDYIGGCLDYLSASDLLYPSWDVFFGGRGRGFGGGGGRDVGSHILRQDEMAFQVAVRGMLFSLPSPVKRQAHPTTGRGGGGSGDAYKMYYPTYLKLWRSKEELEGLVDLWATKMLKGDDDVSGSNNGMSKLSSTATAPSGFGSAAFRKPAATAGNGAQPPPSTSNWHTNNKQPSQARTTTTTTATQPPTPLLSLGSAARRELLLERLPYMAHMARRRRGSLGPGGAARARELEKMVSFHGIGTLGAGEEEEEGDEGAEDGGGGGGGGGGAGEQWATDRPTEERSPRKRRGLGAILSHGSSGSGRGGGKAAGQAEVEEMARVPMQSLVISDDDIEDD